MSPHCVVSWLLSETHSVSALQATSSVQQLSFWQVAHALSPAIAGHALVAAPHCALHFVNRHEKNPLAVVSLPEQVAQSCESVQLSAHSTHVVSSLHDSVCEQQDCAAHVSQVVASGPVEHCWDELVQLAVIPPRRPVLVVPVVGEQLLLLLEEHPKNEMTAAQASVRNTRVTICM